MGDINGGLSKASGGTKDITSLISDCEQKSKEEEEGTDIATLEDGSRGGRRKSQLFMDLCAKFDERGLVQRGETERHPENFVIQSKDPNVLTGKRDSTFSSLRDNWNLLTPKCISRLPTRRRGWNRPPSRVGINTNLINIHGSN